MYNYTAAVVYELFSSIAKLHKRNNVTCYKEIHHTIVKQRNTYLLSIPRIVINDDQLGLPLSTVSKFAFKSNVTQKRKAAVPRSMTVKALMTCEDGT